MALFGLLHPSRVARYRRRGLPPVSTIHRSTPGCRRSFPPPREQHPRENPDSTRRAARLPARRRSAASACRWPPRHPPAPSSPPRLPSAPSRSCPTRRGRRCSPRPPSRVALLGANLVEALLGQLQHLGPFAVQRHPLPRRCQGDARRLPARPLRSGRSIDHVPDRAPRRRLAVVPKVSHHAVHERQIHRPDRGDRSRRCR